MTSPLPQPNPGKNRSSVAAAVFAGSVILLASVSCSRLRPSAGNDRDAARRAEELNRRMLETHQAINVAAGQGQ